MGFSGAERSRQDLIRTLLGLARVLRATHELGGEFLYVFPGQLWSRIRGDPIKITELAFSLVDGSLRQEPRRIHRVQRSGEPWIAGRESSRSKQLCPEVRRG